MNLYCFSSLLKGNGHILVGIHYTPTSITRYVVLPVTAVPSTQAIQTGASLSMA